MEFPFLSFLTVAEAHRYLKEKKPTGQLILLKGSRGIALEALKDTL